MKFIFPLVGLLLIFSGCVDVDNKNKGEMTFNKSTNPFLQEWKTPHGTPPFDKIKSEDYKKAIEFGIKEQEIEIGNIINNGEKPNFQNTIVALEQSGKLLKKVTQVLYAVEAANTDDVLKKTSKEVKPMLASHRDKITLNKKLFQRVKVVYDRKNTLKLSDEDAKLLEEKYKSFIRAGANLDDAKQKKLKEINKKLATLSQQFGDNLLDETNNFELYVTDSASLGKMPSNFVEAAAEEAVKRGHKSGWSFTLQRPSIYPFLDYSPNRELREKIFRGYEMRANNDNDSDNKKILEEMVKLRIEKAKILGYKSHAHYVLENNMAANPKNAYQLLDKVWASALKLAKKDRDMLKAAMKADGVKGEFKGSDWRYYVKKIRNKKYKFDEDVTRPYFEVNAVKEGAFKLANKLFGLSFKERKDISTWHKDQQVYEVLDSTNKHVGILYMDFFARPSKRGGAWMNELRMQSNVGDYVTPIVTNNFNFPAPTKSNPSLLSFSQAQTVFHEFGHALHGLLSNVKYASLSGTNVPRDFVEFPSQVLENWMSEPEVLAMYAKHYKTGEVIPDDMVKKMNAANSFNEGFRSLEYLAASYLDMAWHTLEDTTTLLNTNEFEEKNMGKLGLIEEIVPRYRSTYFAHIFSGGYSAGYYSYIWSEILDADCFEAFKESGDILNPELAKKYKKLISQGGTKSGMELYKEFRGREPKIDALLKKKGFISN